MKKKNLSWRYRAVKNCRVFSLLLYLPETVAAAIDELVDDWHRLWYSIKVRVPEILWDFYVGIASALMKLGKWLHG